MLSPSSGEKETRDRTAPRGEPRTPRARFCRRTSLRPSLGTFQAGNKFPYGLQHGQAASRQDGRYQPLSVSIALVSSDVSRSCKLLLERLVPLINTLSTESR